MKKRYRCLIIFLILISIFINIPIKSIADEEINGLYALSAVLMDAESGRVLYEKDGYTKRAMASTTKIMTCIIALENGKLDDLVTVSKYAASMPDVQLNIKEGEKYLLKDLLYSLMLESHNDSAVAIAEHIGGSVEGFARLMNKKAEELGCKDTYFITPNGLDATKDEEGIEKMHSTTARDLATIMSYCIKNDDFLKITRTRAYTFSNKTTADSGEVANGGRAFGINNKNAFLDMVDGVISGKTGFTGNAGYCYVCAVENNGRKYAIALLGCGWPNNKTYKWSDAKKLLKYGIDNYIKKDLFMYNQEFDEIEISDGIYGRYKDYGTKGICASKKVYIKPYIKENSFVALCKEGETAKKEVYIEKNVRAPVKKGQCLGYVRYTLDDSTYKIYEIYSKDNIDKKDFKWSLGCVLMKFTLQ